MLLQVQTILTLWNSCYTCSMINTFRSKITRATLLSALLHHLETCVLLIYCETEIHTSQQSEVEVDTINDSVIQNLNN